MTRNRIEARLSKLEGAAEEKRGVLAVRVRDEWDEATTQAAIEATAARQGRKPESFALTVLIRRVIVDPPCRPSK